MDEADNRFLKERTGIEDDGELKAHVIRVAREGYEVCEYLTFILEWNTSEALK